MKKSILLIYCTLFCFVVLYSQNTIKQDTLLLASNSSVTKAASSKLLNSIANRRPVEEIAANYAALAKTLSASGDYVKAASYMNKAIQLEATSVKQTNLANYYRELARIQEAQKQYSPASQSYSRAAELAVDSLNKRLNRNDAQRMLVKSSPATELQLLNQNAAILNSSGNTIEIVENLTQQASTNIALNNNTQALNNFREVLNSIDSSSEKAVQVKSNMVDLLVSSNDLQNAVVLQKEIIQSTKTVGKLDIQVSQLINLSEILLQLDSQQAALNVLEETYQLALQKGSVKEAQKSLLALSALYEKLGKEQESKKLYSRFIEQLDTLLARDSSLIDRSLFQLNEDKIYQLEQQQQLKDELLLRKNNYNYVLIGSVIVLLILLSIIIKTLFSIRRRNKLIALQSLRREMNPHFIFNSLNSVNQFIAVNNEREANRYLTSYSNLMRNIMENSNKDYIPLSTELDLLRRYLELEKLRFPDKFDYQLEIASDINIDEVQVPNMLIQPNIENAIWHGLRYKETSGKLHIHIKKNGSKIVVLIEDNGIGLTESKRIKTNHQKQYDSVGLKNVYERIRLLNAIYKKAIRIDIAEKKGNETGTSVLIEW